MRYPRLMTVLCSLGLLLMPVVGSGDVGGPQIQHWTTDRGLKVYFVRAEALPMVDLELTFDAGSARDGDSPGLAALTSRMLTQGAAGLDAAALARGFEDLGARYSTDSGRDTASVSLRSLNAPSTLSRAVEGLARLTGRPDFPEDALERERRRMLVSLRNQQRDPSSIAQRAFWEALYPDHPYGSPPGGTEESLQAITRDDLQGFHQRYYNIANATLTLVGDISRPEAEQIATHLASALRSGEPAEPVPPAPEPGEAREIRIEFPSSQTHVLVGHIGYPRGADEHFALYVGNHILGGSGLVSRLAHEFREERGLSYSVSSRFSPMRAAGPFRISTQVRSDRTGEALETLQAMIADFRAEGPSDSELEDAVRNITGSFPLSLDSNSKIAGLVSTVGFHGLPLDYLDTFPRQIEGVTRDEIVQALRQRVHPERFVTVVVGPDAEDED
ncbi:MAG: insulinase family protein [Ectothiorhodospiraceae bacterium]|nr:insulinase family protein [Ectothiorhodospiraceae bacterium]